MSVQTGRVLVVWGGEVSRGGEVEVIEEEVGHAAVEDDDLDIGIRLQFGHDLDEPEHGFPDDEVDGWIGEGDLRDLR